MATARVRSSGSGVQPFAEAAITNPIFFIPPTYGSGGRFARNTEIGDFNGDGKSDLLISNECVSDADCTQGSVAVLLGNGDGSYQPALVSNTGAVLASVTIGDFNRDGKLDVVGRQRLSGYRVHKWLGEYPAGKWGWDFSATRRLPVRRQCFFGRSW